MVPRVRIICVRFWHNFIQRGALVCAPTLFAPHPISVRPRPAYSVRHPGWRGAAAGAPGTSISPTSIGRWAEFSRIQRMMTAARSKSGSRTMKFAQDLSFRYICICEPRYGGIRHPFGMRILPQVSCDDMCGFVWSLVDVPRAKIVRDRAALPPLSVRHETISCGQV